MGSGVLRTSVFTSGSISEGDGVSLAPAMTPSPPPPTETVSLLCSAVLVNAHEETHAKRISRLPDASVAAAAQRAERRRQRVASCGITGSSDTLRREAAALQLSQRSSIPAGGERQVFPLRRRHARVVTMQRQSASAQPSQAIA